MPPGRAGLSRAGAALTLIERGRAEDELGGGGILKWTGAMEAFDHIINWKLMPGSHPFPGKAEAFANVFQA